MLMPTALAAQQARERIRNKTHRGHTVGLAPGCVQGNLMILPESMAMDFLRFCQQNPAPCPILAVSDPGDPFLPTLGKDIDIRHDIPQYRVWKDGVVVDEPYDIESYWQKDMVSFVIGCSFSFEEALIEEGIPLRHSQEGKNVSMFRTNIETTPAGIFHGPMVVSMRPLKPKDAIRAVQITSRFPKVHGAPVHIGHPESIGIKDITKPDFGDSVEVKDDELPVFWACGVTPQSIAMASKPPICITHAPGCMLVTDLINHQLASF